MSNGSTSDIAYLAAVRRARERDSVIKMRFIDLRGRRPQSPILIFEGDDDKIVYGRWISRLKPNLRYEVFVCKGKKGVRSLQLMLLRDLGSLANNTFLFVDRDYDDDDGFLLNESLFITDRYSVENYLVSKQVLDSVLRDELTCHEHPQIRDAIIELFDKCYDKFLSITLEFNRLLYMARKRRRVINGSLPDKISGYSVVGLAEVNPADTPPESFVVFDDPDLQDDERQKMLSDFDDMNPRHRYRGKNAFLFFSSWLSLLCEELAKKESSMFGGPNGSSRLRRDELTIGTFASKSVMPLGLPEFLDQIAA